LLKLFSRENVGFFWIYSSCKLYMRVCFVNDRNLLRIIAPFVETVPIDSPQETTPAMGE
jgi:hypothetical protein